MKLFWFFFCYASLSLFLYWLMGKEYDFSKNSVINFFVRPISGSIFLVLFFLSGEAWACTDDVRNRIKSFLADKTVVLVFLFTMVLGLLFVLIAHIHERIRIMHERHHFLFNFFISAFLVTTALSLLWNGKILFLLLLFTIYVASSVFVLVKSENKSEWAFYPGAFAALFVLGFVVEGLMGLAEEGLPE